MTQDSTGWTTGGAGDGAATLTRADWSDFMKVIAACMDNEGVAPAYLNALAPTANGANSVRVASGGALVDGKPYWNTADVDTNIPSAVGGGNTRIDRLVLRADWTAQTVRITRIPGTDAGSPTPPAITQTPGTTYDIMLCQALVNTSGAVTVTDERTFAAVGSANGLGDGIVTAAKLAAAVAGNGLAGGAGSALSVNVDNVGIELSSDTLQLKDGGVTAAKIANRTRTFFVPAFAAAGGENRQWGVLLTDGQELSGYGNFHAPADFVSTMTIAPVVFASSAGNMRWSMGVDYGAVDEAFNAHTLTVASTTTACGNDTRETLTASALSSAAAGDYFSAVFTRDGTDGLDTINDNAYLAGFVVSYIADS